MSGFDWPVNCGTCRACCRAPWSVKLYPWEQAAHGGVDKLPKREDGSCVYLFDEGCSLFGHPSRPAVCRQFDCRNKAREWKAAGCPDASPGLQAVLDAAARLTAGLPGGVESDSGG